MPTLVKNADVYSRMLFTKKTNAPEKNVWEKMFILMQNIFIVPAMQHGRHAKPL